MLPQATTSALRLNNHFSPQQPLRLRALARSPAPIQSYAWSARFAARTFGARINVGDAALVPSGANRSVFVLAAGQFFADLEVTVTVTDALGRQDSATALLKANFPPLSGVCSGRGRRMRAGGMGKLGFLLGGGGSIEPPKTGGGEVREKGSIDRTINQLL